MVRRSSSAKKTEAERLKWLRFLPNLCLHRLHFVNCVTKAKKVGFKCISKVELFYLLTIDTPPPPLSPSTTAIFLILSVSRAFAAVAHACMQQRNVAIDRDGRNRPRARKATVGSSGTSNPGSNVIANQIGKV